MLFRKFTGTKNIGVSGFFLIVMLLSENMVLIHVIAQGK